MVQMQVGNTLRGKIVSRDDLGHLIIMLILASGGIIAFINFIVKL
jgi:hypothetical protein